MIFSFKKALLKTIENRKLEGLQGNDVATLQKHRNVILSKPALKGVYSSFYNRFLEVMDEIPEGKVVELGSGSGFLKDVIPSVITSDIVALPHVDKVMSAEKIDFENSSVSAFFLLDVFHHIKNPKEFLTEVDRCLKPNGRLVMVEPAHTLWSRYIRKNFHHEPYEENVGWEIKGSNPMTDANLALPWIVFVRDRDVFTRKFPSLKILQYNPHTPLGYLLSGGISYKSFIPMRLFSFIKFIEILLSPFNRLIGMHVTIDIVKKE